MSGRPRSAYVPTKATVFYGAADRPRVAKFSDLDDAATFARVISSVVGPAEVATSAAILHRFENGAEVYVPPTKTAPLRPQEPQP